MTPHPDPSLTVARRNVAVLATCQALLFTINVTLIAAAALVGYALAADKKFATLPITSWVIGAAVSTYFASLLMQRIGRQRGFTTGTAVGLAGAAISAAAIHAASFWLFCLGMFALGVFNAFGQYYRFAAADAAPEHFKSRAISLVLAGGIVGGIVGPTASGWTRDLLPVVYFGTFLSLIPLLLLTLIALRWLIAPSAAPTESREVTRPLTQIAAQPAFIVAVAGGVVGYGVMNLLMTATPLAMNLCGHSYGAAATVISWHVIGMFAPSFVTGSLIQRFGVLRVMLAGVGLNLGCIAVALAGVAVWNFWLALVLLGVGWNFLYIGGTTLLTETHRPSERARVQGANDVCIFILMAMSSASSGALLNFEGWPALHYVALPFVVLLGTAIVWLMARRRPAYVV